MSAKLPDEFADLARFSSWAVPTMTDRVALRLSRPFEDAKALYEAVQPRLREILAYLDRFPVDELPEDAQMLERIALATAEIATCVEFYGMTTVPKGVEHSRFPLTEPSHVR